MRLVGIALCSFFVLTLLASNAIPSRDESIDSPTASTLSGPNSEENDRQDSDPKNDSDEGSRLVAPQAPDNSADGDGDNGNDSDAEADDRKQNESSDDTDNKKDQNTATAQDADRSGEATVDQTRGARRAASDGPSRPLFEVPFRCGESWELTTYVGHSPEDKKVDFFASGSSTDGKPVLASAGGTVMKLPSPGGVKIDHGGGWYTLYIHMKDISVSVGEDVRQGDRIGRVGTVGTDAAHLHYEQLYNPEGAQAYTDSDIRLPKFAGEKFSLSPGSEAPVLTSKNSCS